MNNSNDEMLVKEILKKALDSNSTIPQRAKSDLKAIIKLEDNPEKLVQEYLLYMYAYRE